MTQTLVEKLRDICRGINGRTCHEWDKPPLVVCIYCQAADALTGQEGAPRQVACPKCGKNLVATHDLVHVRCMACDHEWRVARQEGAAPSPRADGSKWQDLVKSALDCHRANIDTLSPELRSFTLGQINAFEDVLRWAEGTEPAAQREGAK